MRQPAETVHGRTAYPGSTAHDTDGHRTGSGHGYGQKRRPRKPKGNQPDFALAAELERILGVNAARIDGIDVMTIQTVLAEVGPDLSAWKTEAQWSSWLNLAPKRDISGGKVIRHRREYRTNRVGNAFRMAAESLVVLVST